MSNRLKAMKARHRDLIGRARSRMARENERWDRRAHNKPKEVAVPKGQRKEHLNDEG